MVKKRKRLLGGLVVCAIVCGVAYMLAPGKTLPSNAGSKLLFRSPKENLGGLASLAGISQNRNATKPPKLTRQLSDSTVVVPSIIDEVPVEKKVLQLSNGLEASATKEFPRWKSHNPYLELIDSPERIIEAIGSPPLGVKPLSKEHLYATRKDNFELYLEHTGASQESFDYFDYISGLADEDPEPVFENAFLPEAKNDNNPYVSLKDPEVLRNLMLDPPPPDIAITEDDIIDDKERRFELYLAHTDRAE